MEISAKHSNLSAEKTPCIVVGVYEKKQLSESASQLDQASDGYLSRIIKRGDLNGGTGNTLMLHDVPGLACERVLLCGCGKKDEMDLGAYRKMIAAAVSALNNASLKSALLTLHEIQVAELSGAMRIRHASEVAQHSLYRFSQTKSEKKSASKLGRLVLQLKDSKQGNQARQAIQQGQAIAEGMNVARELGNLPGNICTPSYLASQAKSHAKNYPKLKVTALGEKEIEKLGMGSFLSVAKGSRQPPKLIVMEYRGGKQAGKPHVLVGKGITFDSGGISIKPGPAMDEMKFDMCGAASVIGTMVSVCEMALPINVVAIVPSCENMPDGAANKPGDVVTSMSGQTIEILNTDAEGRLILCDALTYSEKFKPEAVIDVATLTGACVIALGKHPSGLMSNHQPLADQLLAAGTTAHDRAWQLPLWDEYQEQLKSNFADMANIGGRDAGTITAACFLSRFAKKLNWAHLDIAGVAWESGAAKGATGRPVPLLSQYLLDRCGKKYQL